MFIRLLLVLLPLGLFMFLAQAIPLSPLQSLLLLVPVIAFEVWLVIRHLLPVMGELVTKTLYSSNITTDEEVLVEASRRMLNSGDPQGALELLERYRKENPGLVRSWLMESSLLNDMRRYADSVNVLQKGLEYGGWRKEPFTSPSSITRTGPGSIGRKLRINIPIRPMAAPPWTNSDWNREQSKSF